MIVPIPTRENICAVVVTYNPDPDFASRFDRIARTAACVVIVDNGSRTDVVAILRDLSARPDVHLIENGDNLGIATALNRGVAEAERRGFPWALLFDHDTIPLENFLAVTSQVYRQVLQPASVAVIGANYLQAFNNKPAYRFDPAPLAWIERKVVITSGSLVSIAAFRSIGPFMDELFIDHVDYEYCLRARAKGYRVVMAKEPTIIHPLGNKTPHSLLGFSVTATHHPPLRRYYMARNAIILARIFLLREPVWLLNAWVREAKALVAVLLYETQKTKKLRYTILGYFHGIRGKTGPLA